MSGFSRREALETFGVSALAWSFLSGSSASAKSHMSGEPESYSLPPLPYDYDALQPQIDESVVRIHHDRHHAGYVNGLNSTLEKLAKAREEGDMSGVKPLSNALAYHGSGHMLHTLYWESMAPGGNGRPSEAMGKALMQSFGSAKGFKNHFLSATKSVEGSGWGLLAWEPVGERLVVLQIEKHQNLTIWGVIPLMVCDVWEHAYYDQYQNRRGDYVDGFWELIDWKKTSKRFEMAAEAGSVLPI